MKKIALGILLALLPIKMLTASNYLKSCATICAYGTGIALNRNFQYKAHEKNICYANKLTTKQVTEWLDQQGIPTQNIKVTIDSNLEHAVVDHRHYNKKIIFVSAPLSYEIYTEHHIWTHQKQLLEEGTIRHEGEHILHRHAVKKDLLLFCVPSACLIASQAIYNYPIRKCTQLLSSYGRVGTAGSFCTKALFIPTAIVISANFTQKILSRASHTFELQADQSANTPEMTDARIKYFRDNIYPDTSTHPSSFRRIIELKKHKEQLMQKAIEGKK